MRLIEASKWQSTVPGESEGGYPAPGLTRHGNGRAISLSWRSMRNRSRSKVLVKHHTVEVFSSEVPKAVATVLLPESLLREPSR
jgi:hypothetical protein